MRWMRSGPTTTAPTNTSESSVRTSSTSMYSSPISHPSKSSRVSTSWFYWEKQKSISLITTTTYILKSSTSAPLRPSSWRQSVCNRWSTIFVSTVLVFWPMLWISCINLSEDKSPTSVNAFYWMMQLKTCSREKPRFSIATRKSWTVCTPFQER